MKKVTVKAKNPQYNGFVRGYQFHHGIASDVPLEDAIAMKEFGIEILEDKPEVKEEPVKAPKSPKRSPRKKVGE